ncbi:MAG: hypothetical protein LCH76_14990 [Actinobacteria bacterium]|nr:hypothetical protein [Actinomycetota bacterium]
MSRSQGPTPAAAFDLRDFTRTARGSHRDRLDLASYAARPLDCDTLNLVRLLARLERGALSQLRSVLVTPTHSDARMTAFLVTWAYEKFWLADALEAISEAHPAPTATMPTPLARRLRHAWQALGERLEPIRESVVSNLIGEDVVAVHCLAGTLDEWLVQAAYQRLAETTSHDDLARTLDELREVKRRHLEFFESQAGQRLAASPSAARLARRRLPRTGFPLGSSEEPPEALARLLDGLLTAADLRAIDRRLDSYPGLAGLGLATAAGARAARRPDSPSKGDLRP